MGDEPHHRHRALVASNFKKIQETLKKKLDEKEEEEQSGSFPVGSGGSAATINRKNPLFLKQEYANLFASIEPQTPQEPVLSTSEKCLAILGVTVESTNIPSEEEIKKARLEREQDIKKRYEDIKRIAEERDNHRPLVWDKPTFCPFGGETKSDSNDDAEKASQKRKERVSPSEISDNLFFTRCSSSERHNRMLRNCNMYSMNPNASSVVHQTEWSKVSKEEIDSFVEFVNKWFPKEATSREENKKIKLDDQHHYDNDSSSATTASSEVGEGEGDEDVFEDDGKGHAENR